MNKYCTSADYGIVDNKTVLELVDDAANANWGGDWRMPTIDDCQELIDNCTWTLCTMSNMDGYKVTGLNGNYIFLPFAGYRTIDSFYNAASYGRYWSSSLGTDYTYSAQYLNFYSDNVGTNIATRGTGHPVRAVHP